MLDIAELEPWLEKLGIQAADAQNESMSAFLKRLYEANATRNLTRVPPEQATIRHVVDSLLVAKYIPSGSSVLDIGTGAGFPSMPLAVYRPDLKVTAWDGSERPIAVLRELAPDNLRVEKVRAEEESRAEFDFVTGRALAPFPIQAELSIPQLKVGGIFVALRTVRDEQDVDLTDLESLGAKLELKETVSLGTEEAVRLFPIVRKATSTRKRYPRTWSEIKRAPLLRKVG